MASIFYGSLLVASLVCTAIYICKWHKHFNTNINMIFAFIPIAIMGFLYFSVSKNIGEAVSAQKLMYLGSSFLQLFMLLSLFNLCRIEIKKWQRLSFFVLYSYFFLMKSHFLVLLLLYFDLLFHFLNLLLIVSLFVFSCFNIVFFNISFILFNLFFSLFAK